MVNKLWEKNKYIILSTLAFGFVAHGMALFNLFCAYDDARYLNGVGFTYKSGRWMLGIIEKLHLAILGNGTTLSTPLFNGILSLIFIAVAACFITDMLKIKNRYLQIMLAGVMVTVPVITCLFAYMFTAPYYMLAVCAGSFAVWLISRNKRWYCWLTGGIILGCSTGIYQAYIPFFIGLCLLACINEVYTTETYSLKSALKAMLYYGGACIVMLLSYLLLNKLLLAINNTSLSAYGGINSFGSTDFKGYIKRIILAYKEFLLPASDSQTNIYSLRSICYYYISAVIGTIFSTIIAIDIYKRSGKLFAAVIELLLICLAPLAANFIYVMCEQNTIHLLMVYGNIIIFIYLVWAAENAEAMLPKNLACTISAVILLLMNLVYLKYDNICYLEAEILQEESKSYYTELVMRIQSTEGYNTDMPIIYVNEKLKLTDSSLVRKTFKAVDIWQYAYYYSANEADWKLNMKIWTGFDPVIGDVENLGNTERIAELTAYPDEGSIAVIDGNVVVKFY